MKLSRRAFLRSAAGLGAFAALGFGGRSNVHELVYTDARLGGLKGPLRIMFVADLHMPWCYVDADELAAAAQAFQPHLLLIGGDSFDKPGNEHLVRIFGASQATCGKLAILGNWEHWADADMALLKKEYEAVGVRLLVNEVVDVEHADFGRVRIVGLDDLLGGSPKPQKLLAGLDPAVPTIVLAHCPEQFDKLPNRPLLCLSGHTHAGQIAPFGITLGVPPGSGDYVKGWYRKGEASLYVTRGLGNNILPFRFGPRPEVALLTLGGLAQG